MQVQKSLKSVRWVQKQTKAEMIRETGKFWVLCQRMKEYPKG